MTYRNPLLQTISNWFRRTFADPDAVSLFFILLFSVLLLEFFGHILMPILVSIVIAYLLEVLVKLLKRWKCPHLIAVIIVCCFFLGLIALLIFILLPLLWKQMSSLLSDLPQTFDQGQRYINDFMEHYPKISSAFHVKHLIVFFKNQSGKMGQWVVQYSLASIPSLIEVILYIVLVPLLVFFFLKDSQGITHWFSQYMPSHPSLVYKVWSEVNEKIGAYVRGRVLEIIIVGTVAIIAFELMKLQYAFLLGVLVGLSVIVPYIGAIVVTIPVVLVSLMQWGFTMHFVYLIIIFGMIILLDANLLWPLLISGYVHLHPIVVILAVVVFGGFWGFWGVFFAVPLATFVNAILKAWPRKKTPA